MLKRLYDIALQFREYFLFGFFIAVSAFLLATKDSRQIRTIRSMTVVMIGSLQDAVSFVPQYFDLRRENRVLREMNLSLSEEVSRLREARLENLRLRNLLGFKERSPYHLVSASIIGKTLQMLRNTITLNVGENRGIHVNMPLVNDEGLVGKIVATSGGYSIGQILLNREMRVSAKIQRSRVDGIIRWDGGSQLTLQDVAKTLDVQVGDLVMTSEYSNLFPPDIRIGIVSAIRQIPGSLFQAIDITPSVDFTRLEEVFVITEVPDSSRIDLELGYRE